MTLAVATVLITVAVPSFTTLSLNSQRVSSINELVTAMHFARSSAVTRNARVTVCTSSNGTACETVAWDRGWVIFSDDNGNQIVDGGETVFRSGSEERDVSFVSTEFSNFFVYRPNGRVMAAAVTTNAGNFTFCDRRGAAYARVVVIELGGRPRLSETMMDGSVPTCP